MTKVAFSCGKATFLWLWNETVGLLAKSLQPLPVRDLDLALTVAFDEPSFAQFAEFAAHRFTPQIDA